MNKINSILAFFLLFFLLSGCGFKVADKTPLKNYNIKEIETKGDKKSGFIIKSIFFKTIGNKGNENLKITIDTNKEKEIKEKNSNNRVTRYEINLSTKVTINYLDDNKVKVYSNTISGSYNVSDNHTTTINNQKNLEKNLAKKSGERIIKELLVR